MYRFRSIFKYSKLNQSLNSFVKKYKMSPKIPTNTIPQPINEDKNYLAKPVEQNQESIDDYLKQKYLLSKAKPIDIFEKDEFSHMNRPQQLALHKQYKETEQKYKEELDVMKLNKSGEQLVDDFKLPKKFLRGLDIQRVKGQRMLKDVFRYGELRFSKKCKFNSIREWKKYMTIKKPRLDNLVMEKIKRYPGTEKGPLPWNDKKRFTKWFNENHSQKTIDSARALARRAQRFPLRVLEPERAALLKNEKRAEELMMKEREVKFPLPERKKEAKWKIGAAGPALFCKQTMVEQYLKGDPLQDLENNLYVRLQSHIPDNEVPPLPDKHPLQKEKLIAYLERWTFYRSLQAFELARDILNGKVKPTKSEPTKTASLNTYYQLLPKYLRDDPNVKNVYRGLEFGNNQMSLEAKEKALNLAAKLTLPFDELNEEVFDAGSSGYRDHVSRFDEERLIQDQENEHVDQAIAPDVTFKYGEQRKHTPLHVAKDDYKLPDWAVDKQERVDDLPVDYYINDDGFWDDYIAAKEQKHLTDSPIHQGKAFFRHN